MELVTLCEAILFLTAGALTVLTISSLTRPNYRGKGSYLAIVAGMVMWTVLKGLELNNDDPDSKLVFLKFEYTSIALLPPALLVFSIQYSGLYRVPRWTDIALLIAVPILVIGLVATSDYHGLFWTDVTIGHGTLDYLVLEPGPFFYVHTAYSYLLVLIAGTLMLLVAFKDRRHRVQSALLIAAAVLPAAGGVAFEVVLGIRTLDITPMLFSLSAILLGLAIYRYDLLSSQPLTRDIVFDNIEDPIMTLDSNGSVIDMNKSAEMLTGSSRKEASRIPLKDLLPLRDSSIDDLLSGRSRTLEMKDSKGRRILIQTLKMSDGCRLLTIKDITKLKEAEMVLRRSHRELEDLVDIKTSELRTTADKLREEVRVREEAERRSCEEASRSELLLDLMGHDIGNLNQAIYGRVQLMRAKEDDHAWLKKNIAILDENLRRAVHLVENVRTMSYLEKTCPEPRPMNLSTLAIRCVEMIVDTFPTKKVMIHREGVEEDVFVLGESVLERAILNILHNAVKYQGDPAEVWISLRPARDRAVLTVSDAGGGIDPSKRVSLLERRKRAGDISLSGVGLMFSTTVVERLHGSIKVGDRIEGDWTQGAKFTIEIPLDR